MLPYPVPDITQRLAEGVEPEKLVIQKLASAFANQPITVSSIQLPPQDSRPYGWTSQKQFDIVLNHWGTMKAATVEVKGRKQKFTSSPDSFPYDTVMVDAVAASDAKLHKPFAYVMVSTVAVNPSRAMLVVPGWTRESWTASSGGYDSRLERQMPPTSYAPKDSLIPFVDFEGYLLAYLEGDPNWLNIYDP